MVSKATEYHTTTPVHGDFGMASPQSRHLKNPVAERGAFPECSSLKYFDRGTHRPSPAFRGAITLLGLKWTSGPNRIAAFLGMLLGLLKCTRLD